MEAAARYRAQVAAPRLVLEVCVCNRSSKMNSAPNTFLMRTRKLPSQGPWTHVALYYKRYRAVGCETKADFVGMVRETQ